MTTPDFDAWARETPDTRPGTAYAGSDTNELARCPRHGIHCLSEIPDLAERIECAIGLGDSGANGPRRTAGQIMMMVEDHVAAKTGALLRERDELAEKLARAARIEQDHRALITAQADTIKKYRAQFRAWELAESAEQQLAADLRADHDMFRKAASEDDAEWLIWSHEHGAWWRPFECGYTGELAEAGRYIQDRAEQICRNANAYGWVNGLPKEVMIPWTDDPQAAAAAVRSATGSRFPSPPATWHFSPGYQGELPNHIGTLDRCPMPQCRAANPRNATADAAQDANPNGRDHR